MASSFYIMNWNWDWNWNTSWFLENQLRGQLARLIWSINRMSSYLQLYGIRESPDNTVSIKKYTFLHTVRGSLAFATGLDAEAQAAKWCLLIQIELD